MLRTRGYVLLEAMVGAAMVGTALLAAFSQVGRARADSIRQTREIVAQQVVTSCLEFARTESDKQFGDLTTNASCELIDGAPTAIALAPLTAADCLTNANVVTDHGKYISRLFKAPVQDEEVRTSDVLKLQYTNFTAATWYLDPRNLSQCIPIVNSTRIYAN
jgi:type II secretory pathway pseudopilin PulG